MFPIGELRGLTLAKALLRTSYTRSRLGVSADLSVSFSPFSKEGIGAIRSHDSLIGVILTRPADIDYDHMIVYVR